LSEVNLSPLFVFWFSIWLLILSICWSPYFLYRKLVAYLEHSVVINLHA
jgi:hypothetical protein